MPNQKVSTVGQRSADFFAKIVRSWRFVIFQLVFVFIWIVSNQSFNPIRFDPYPFETLKLLLTIEIFFIGSMILINQNSQSERDRNVLYQEYILDCKNNKELRTIHPLIDENKIKVEEILNLLKNK